MLEKIQKIITNLNYSEFDNEKTAVMITAYNRPQYFEKVVDSINYCEELKNIPIFVFLDGGTLSTKNENIEICKKIKFKNKFVIVREKNYGCERNILSAFKMMFNDLNFNFLFVLEDDLVLSKNYFRFVYDEYKKIKQEDLNLGIYQGWNKCLLNKEEKKHKLQENIHSIDEHYWGFLWEKETFKKIEKYFDQYMELLVDIPYDPRYKNIRDSKFLEILNLHNKFSANKINSNYYAIEKIKNLKIALGHDAILDLALYLEDLKRYLPIVNRSVCIGKEGVHQYPGLWETMELSKVILDDFAPKKFGVIYCGYNNIKYAKESLKTWVDAAEKFNIKIAAVSVPFYEYKDENIISDGTTEMIEKYYKDKKIKYFFDSPKYIKESEARNLCLNALLEEEVDYIFIADSDELYTIEQIEKIINYVLDDTENSIFKINFKNYIFDGKTWIDNFCPWRIFKTNVHGGIQKFYWDNEIIFNDNKNVHDVKNIDIPKDIAFIKHMTWLHENGKNKYEYQMKHFGECSYTWNYEKQILELNKEYYVKNNYKIPNFFKDTGEK